MSFKIGSLFDGSGGFPLAAFMCGGIPTWAAEIEPYPIAVTKSRFPTMKHLGSVTDINGKDVEPVDIITFGSPCQDLSVAGKRAGLKHEANGDDETTRSGLFMEAVRIIKEMREATNGRYPTFALWENVPGAFSSNKGEDFRTVCEELIHIVEPTAVMPEVPKNGWAYADVYCGNGWSLAYRVFDAQYWGVPQRRRRIYALLDLRGERAGKILFERESLRGYFTKGRTPWQTASADAQGSFGAADNKGVVGLDVYNQTLTGEKSKTLNSAATDADHVPCVIESAGFCPEQSAKTRGIGFENEEAPTLRAGVTPAVVYALDQQGGKGSANYAENVMPTLCSDSHGTPHAVAYTANDSRPLCMATQQGGAEIMENKCPTITAAAGMSGNNQPVVVYNNDTICCETFHCNCEENKAKTLKARDYKDPHVVCYWDGSQTAGTLTANNAGGNQRMPDKENFNCVIDQKPICYRQGGFADYVEGEVGTLRAAGGDFGGGSENLIRTRYIVRRLTPTECARLQGFPDKWGHPDKKDDFTDEEYKFWLEVRNLHAAINEKAVKEYTKEQMLTWYNKLHSDSNEYKMWGNGIALPCALYVMQGVGDALN